MDPRVRGRPTRKHWQYEDRAKVALGRKITSSSKGERSSITESAPKKGVGETHTGRVHSINTYFEAKAGGQASNLGRKGQEDRSGGPQDPTLEEESDRKFKGKEPTGETE